MAVALVVVLSSATGVVVPNEQVISDDPVGGVQVRSIDPLNPFVAVMVMVDVPDWPGAAILTGLPPSENAGVTTKPGQEVSRILASIVPSPVTRS